MKWEILNNRVAWRKLCGQVLARLWITPLWRFQKKLIHNLKACHTELVLPLFPQLKSMILIEFIVLSQ
jgi:hypothetical protein